MPFTKDLTCDDIDRHLYSKVIQPLFSKVKSENNEKYFEGFISKKRIITLQKHEESLFYLFGQIRGKSKTTSELAKAKGVSLGTVSEQLTIGRTIGIFKSTRAWKTQNHSVNWSGLTDFWFYELYEGMKSYSGKKVSPEKKEFDGVLFLINTLLRKELEEYLEVFGKMTSFPRFLTTNKFRELFFSDFESFYGELSGFRIKIFEKNKGLELFKITDSVETNLEKNKRIILLLALQSLSYRWYRVKNRRIGSEVDILRAYLRCSVA